MLDAIVILDQVHIFLTHQEEAISWSRMSSASHRAADSHDCEDLRSHPKNDAGTTFSMVHIHVVSFLWVLIVGLLMS